MSRKDHDNYFYNYKYLSFQIDNAPCFFFGSPGFDPGPLGPIKSGRGHPGDKIFTDFQVRGSILTDFHEFSRFLSIFGV